MTQVPTLSWSIKDSLLVYIDALEDGNIAAEEGASFSDGAFNFSAAERVNILTPEHLSGSIQFRGSAILSGHWGAMRIEIHDPRVEISEGLGDLFIRTNSVISAERFESFATLSLESATENELCFKAALTPAGRMLLGQQYSVGQELSCVRMLWS